MNLGEIPRVSKDADINSYLCNEKPVIVTNCSLVSNSVKKWVPSYLAKTFGEDMKLTVKRSKSTLFRYYDESKNSAKYNFKKPNDTINISFADFLRRTQEKDGKYFYYLQETLSNHSELSEDFKEWDWSYILNYVKTHKWGLPERNLLLVGMKEATTPTHYDEQQNMYCQISGTKEVILYSPKCWDQMYTFPVGHPCDRQCMVQIKKPNLERCPRFANAKGIRAVLQPGDMLFIPAMWFHYFRNLDNLSTSVSFWCRQPSPEKVVFPLPDATLVSVRRNMEMLIMSKLPSPVLMRALCCDEKTRGTIIQEMSKLALNVMKPEDVKNFVNLLLSGRYDIPDRWVEESVV